MATTVAQHSVATFTSPVNGTTPIDANTVRGNDNTTRAAYNDHDADPGIHVQSSTLASRPVAGTAGRKWITEDSGVYTLWFDDGTNWHPVSSENIALTVLAGENLVKGDVVKVTGWNNGQDLPEVVKTTSAADTAFAVITATVSSGSMGYATNTGIVQDVNTAAYSVGTILYANGSGGFTSTKPTSGHYQPVAYVLRANASNGVYYVEFSTPRIVERSDNTASTVVLRDASGNFSAGTVSVGALTSAGLVTFASLKGTGATTVTDILNDSTMATASATTLATSASIKTYVDTKVATVDTLAEVLANGNTTGANDIIVNAGQKIRTPAVAAQDGTSAISIANSTGALTLSSALADSNLATISTAGKVANSATTATNANTASAIVARDGSGNFSAGTITATLNGAAPAGSLSGSTLASGVTASSLTSVGTLSSLTVSGNLTVDTNTLFVDATNNRVGVGTTSPSYRFDISNTGGSAAGIRLSGNDQSNVRLRLDNTGTGGVAWELTGGLTGANNSHFSLYDATAAATRLSVDGSGNLAVDTNTLYVDAANNRVSVGTTTLFSTFTVTSGTNARYELSAGATSVTHEALDTNRVNSVPIAAYASRHQWFVRSGGSYVQAAEIDASGNLGLGVTPSAWSAFKPALQVGTASLSQIANRAYVTANGYYNGTAWTYVDTDYATQYFQQNGTHIWNTASSGTAGNAISFTQAMTLDASGNLCVGTTSPTFNASNRGNITLSGSDGGIVALGPALTFGAYLYYQQSSKKLDLWNTADGIMSLGTNNTERARIDASGNLGLGVTPSAWASAAAGYSVMQIRNAAFYGISTNIARMSANAFVDGSGVNTYISNGFATRHDQVDGEFRWLTAPSGTAGNAITFHEGANLSGTTNTTLRVNCASGGSFSSEIAFGAAGFSAVAGVKFEDNNGALNVYADSTRIIKFSTGAVTGSSERARITSGGYFKASNTGAYAGSTAAYHEIRSDASDWVAKFQNTASSGVTGVVLEYTASSPNGTGNAFLYCTDSAALRAEIRSNGGLANYSANDVNLSDLRVKKDITPVATYWSKIKAIEVVTFKYNDQTHDDDNVGVIAQQVEAVAPEFVDADGFGETPADGVPLKAIYNTDLQFAALRALQEAMARIETLEQRVLALEA